MPASSVQAALLDRLGPPPWSEDRLAKARITLEGGAGPIDLTETPVAQVRVQYWDDLAIHGYHGPVWLRGCTVADPAGLATASELSLEEVLLTHLPGREGGYQGTFARVPLDEASASTLKNRDEQSLSWCRRVAGFGLVARATWATVSFLQPGRRARAEGYPQETCHRHDQASELIEAGDVEALLLRPAAPPPPALPPAPRDGPLSETWQDLTSEDPDRWIRAATRFAEAPAGSDDWVAWVATRLRYAPPQAVGPLVAALQTRHTGPCSPALAATLRAHFPFFPDDRRLLLARLHASPLLDEGTRAWFQASIEADRLPQVRDVLGGDAWATCPLAPSVRARLRAVGASWDPAARPHAGFPAPFDRLATGLTLPPGLSLRGDPIQLYAWDPAEPEQQALRVDPRRWARVGMCGPYHELYLALEGDDPPIVELDHDGSDTTLHPTPLSRWLAALRSP